MMPDRGKVIKLIEEEISVCESVNQCYRTIDLPTLRDILALLKQEAVEPKVIRTNGFGYPVHACGKCGLVVTESMNYCSRCGQAVKWE